jgi:hypothetical protein
LPGSTPLFMVSRQQFMKNPGYSTSLDLRCNPAIFKML